MTLKKIFLFNPVFDKHHKGKNQKLKFFSRSYSKSKNGNDDCKMIRSSEIPAGGGFQRHKKNRQLKTSGSFLNLWVSKRNNQYKYRH